MSESNTASLSRRKFMQYVMTYFTEAEIRQMVSSTSTAGPTMSIRK